MKKSVALLLVMAMLFSFAGCMTQHYSYAEDFLIAARTLDFDAMSTYVVLPTTSSSVPFAQEKHYAAMLDEQEKSALISLYSMLQYTMGDVSIMEDYAKSVAVTLKIPDFERIRSLVQAKLLVSGASASEIVREMIEDGTIAKIYMTEKKIQIGMMKSESDDEFYISYNERDNAALIEAFSFIEMLRFFATN